ncbi:MAG: M48 family metalloprotease [Drouetiella hepatica Uher 2000/2452]|uniref:M48 family metalloprotease n=1 Tax=Drouetiella hepatica Uher 2000/2452 TaxID=904376 RepID=A0A951QAX7_9CYAN|nr:M48 family metalloprotease [Drouetiella hepatica Uher 2000/2452]
MTSSQKLSAGLAALKQKDYATAIAQLESVDPSEPHTVQEKAQAALVKAYAQTGQVNRAIALCQTLAQSPNPQVRDWASQTLSHLSQHYSSKTEDETGFVPLNSTPGRSLDQHDPTGFVPSQTSQDRTSEGSNHPRSQTPREVIRRSVALPAVQSSEAQSSEAQSSEAQPPEAQTVVESLSIPSEALVLRSSLPVPPPATTWKNAARAQKWGSLGTVDRSTLWAVTAGTALALMWVIRTLPMMMQDSLYWICFQLAAMTPLKQFVFWVTPASDPWLGVAIALLLLFAVSPWLLDKLLQQFYELRSLRLSALESHSPEAVRLLKRVCQQRRQPLPTLGLLPTDAPLALTYGYLPRNARIVVSQGLLSQLEDEEIAVIYAAELAHIAHWNFGVMSWLTLAAQLPYLLYWQASNWGDRQSDRVLQSLAVLASAFGYGLFWICRLPGLWLSRLRLYHSDRTASELTGNPNGLTRALLKVAIGTAQVIQRWEHTSFLLESFEPLTPVGYRSALTVGSLYLRQSASLEWDRSNPYRRWLSLLNAHPPLGDRLQLLALYAKHWRLTPELDAQTQNQQTQNQQTQKPEAKAPSNSQRRFLLQAAPFVGSLAGLAIALILWLLGGLAARLNWLELSWLWGDRSVLIGSMLIGFSIGMFTRINLFFPDIKRSNLSVNPSLVDLLQSDASLPIDSQPLRLQGKLLGRRGFANWLHQDLMLLTETGLIRLHHTSRWGFLGDLLPQKLRPLALMKHPVTVTGWFRRGATPWIDVDTIQGKGAFLQSQHPLWSTALAIASALLGAFIIVRGGA